MSPKHFISIRDVTPTDVAEIFKLARDIKSSPQKYAQSLWGKTLAMVFEKPSTRTRVSFHAAIHQMGGTALSLSQHDLPLGQSRDTLADTMRSLSQYVDGIVGRTMNHATLVELARHAPIPVINGLTDLLHPCQALSDFYTLTEKKGDLKGKKIAYVGNANHVCHSLLYGAVKVGMDVAVATPPGFEPKPIIVKSANREASSAGVTVVLTQDPSASVMGSEAVYTNPWISIGQEAELEQRAASLAPYQVTAELMAKAKHDALFMHSLPAFRGREVSSDVLDGPQSVVLEQAKNRLFVQKALLFVLLGGKVG